MKLNLLVCFLFVQLFSCKLPPVEEQLEGLWVGKSQGKIGMQDLDRVYYFNADGTGIRLNSDEEETGFKWEWINDVLEVDSTNYIIDFFNGHKLVLKEEDYPIEFVKIEKGAGLKQDVNEIYTLLNNSCWDLDKTSHLNFKTEKSVCFKDGQVIEQDRYYLDETEIGISKEVAPYCLKFIEDELFYYKSTLPDHADSLYYDIQRIHEVSENSIASHAFNFGKKVNLNYKRNKEKFSEEGSSQLCKNTYPSTFYVNLLKYKGSKIAIKNHFMQALDNFEIPKDQNGYLTFRFLVSCKGKMSRFEIQQTDLKFDDSIFDPQLVSLLFKSCQKLENWIPGKDRENQLADTRKFLTFKIVDGKIIDILP